VLSAEPTATFRIEFDRIGRRHNPKPIHLEIPWATEDLDLLAEKIGYAVSGLLLSTETEVRIEIDQPSGRVRCRLLAGMRNAGIGDVTRLDVPDWRPEILLDLDRQLEQKAAIDRLTEELRRRVSQAAENPGLQVTTLQALAVAVDSVLLMDALGGPDESWAAGYWAALKQVRALIALGLGVSEAQVHDLLLGGGAQVATT